MVPLLSAAPSVQSHSPVFCWGMKREIAWLCGIHRASERWISVCFLNRLSTDLIVLASPLLLPFQKYLVVASPMIFGSSVVHIRLISWLSHQQIVSYYLSYVFSSPKLVLCFLILLPLWLYGFKVSIYCYFMEFWEEAEANTWDNLPSLAEPL